MPITAVTFTGADAWTDTAALNKMFDQQPFFEVGILVSLTRAGVDPRYPSQEGILSLLDHLRCPTALHLCGQAAKAFILEGPAAEPIARLLEHPTVSRIQVNVNARRSSWMPEAEVVSAHIQSFGRPVILQEHDGNKALIEQVEASNLQILHDASGGRGIRPERWPAPLLHVPFGFAGGIGPETVEGDLKAITEASGIVDVWIDMEGRIRTADRFDLAKVQNVLDAFSSFRLNATRGVIEQAS